jgi:4-hydroxybenzoate polyprenyltransferase
MCFVSGKALMIQFVRLLRVHQWLKNLMLFFPPFLGGVLFDSGMAAKGVIPFVSFSLIASATYIVNDICDLESDANHPKKRKRPIHAGLITLPVAKLLAIMLFVAGFLTALTLPRLFLLYLCLYLVVTISYSIWLKELPIVDIFCISTGFILRLQSGGVVFGVLVSEWLFLSVFLLAIFLSAGKRLSEKLTLGEMAHTHRKSLAAYPVGFLEGVIYMSGGAVLVTYAMYTITHPMLVYTVPLCCFGLFRYILAVRTGKGGDPTDSLLRDPVMSLVGLAWAGMVGWGIYCR